MKPLLIGGRGGQLKPREGKFLAHDYIKQIFSYKTTTSDPDLVIDHFSKHVEHPQNNLHIHEWLHLQTTQHCTENTLACLQY